MDNRNLIKSYFQKEMGYRLLFAQNGEQALEVLRQRTVSLILLDMEMPVMDGYTAATKIRELEDRAAIPIIALTAHQGKREIDQCLGAGCTAYFAKPIRKKELLEAVRTHLWQSRVVTEVHTAPPSDEPKVIV